MSETTREDRERAHVPGMMGRDRLLPLYDSLCRHRGGALEAKSDGKGG